ncbi:PIN domain-containing protein [soil metagenome]
MSRLLVADASAIVSLLIDPGATGAAAADLMAQAQLHAPDHLPVEVANALRRIRNRGALSSAEALLAIHDFRLLPVQLWPFEVLADRAWELGDNISAYDAAYVALAERIEATLVTADARLGRAPGIRCIVRTV